MKVTTVLGHARMSGSTATVLGWVEDALRAGGHSIDHINVVDYRIGGCTGCNSCKLEPGVPGCVIEDDADGLLHRFIESDLVLFAAPLYCWGFPSQLKALMDRCYALSKPAGEGNISLIAGHKLAFLVVAAGPYENNIELLEAAYPMFAKFVQCELAGKLAVPHCATPSALTDEVRQRAVDFAAELTAGQ